MGKSIYTICLDLQNVDSQETIYAKQGDTDRLINFTLRDGGKPFVLKETDVVVLSTITPEGNTIEESVNTKSGIAIYEFSRELTASIGAMNVELRIYSEGKNVITASFTLVVEARNGVAKSVTEQDSFTALDTVYAQTQKAIEDAEIATTNANDASGRANAAAEVANKAAESANDAAANAESAASDATQATESANNAVTSVGGAIEEARHATSAAQSAAEEATEAANNAENMAYQASDAAQFANIEAQRAGDAANRANEAAEKIEDRSDEVNSTFEKNKWELIKWVCQHDDPSKYWKVGDYKMVAFGEGELGITNLIPDPNKWYGGLGYVYGENYGTVAYLWDLDTFLSAIGRKVGTYTLKCPQSGFAPPFYLYDEKGTKLYEGAKDELGIGFSDKTETPDEWKFVVGNIVKEYPLQIIGFNHDKVANPYEYGKQRAGITLQFGASRHIFGDKIPTLYSPILEGVMADDGIHYKSPCRTVFEEGRYVDKRTNWRDGAFRTSLDAILFSSPLEKFVVSVQKYTSQYYKSSNHYSAAMLTEDRVFLPSEYEVFGEVVNAPCQEGEQYEFYKDGYSKFMWSEELLSGAVPNGRLWLRSAKGADVNESTPDSVSSCSVYMSVTSRPDDNGEGAKVNYQPAAAASNSTAAYIAPCICL